MAMRSRPAFWLVFAVVVAVCFAADADPAPADEKAEKAAPAAPAAPADTKAKAAPKASNPKGAKEVKKMVEQEETDEMILAKAAAEADYKAAEKGYETLHTERKKQAELVDSIKKQARLLKVDLNRMPRGDQHKALSKQLDGISAQQNQALSQLKTQDKEITDSKADLLEKYAYLRNEARGIQVHGSKKFAHKKMELEFAVNRQTTTGEHLKAMLHSFKKVAKLPPNLTFKAKAQKKVMLKSEKMLLEAEAKDNAKVKEVKKALAKAKADPKLNATVAKAEVTYIRAKGKAKLTTNKYNAKQMDIAKITQVIKGIKQQTRAKPPPNECDKGLDATLKQCEIPVDILGKELATLKKARGQALQKKAEALRSTLQAPEEVVELIQVGTSRPKTISEVGDELATATSAKVNCIAKAKKVKFSCFKALTAFNAANKDVAHFKGEADKISTTLANAKHDEKIQTVYEKMIINHVNKNRKEVKPNGIFRYKNTVWYVNTDGKKQMVQYPTPPCARAMDGIHPANFEDASVKKLYLNIDDSTKACKGPVYQGMGDPSLFAKCRCNGAVDGKNQGASCGKWGAATKAWCFVSSECLYPGARLEREDHGPLPAYSKSMQDCKEEANGLPQKGKKP